MDPSKPAEVSCHWSLSVGAVWIGLKGNYPFNRIYTVAEPVNRCTLHHRLITNHICSACGIYIINHIHLNSSEEVPLIIKQMTDQKCGAQKRAQ